MKLQVTAGQETDAGPKDENQDFHGLVVPDNFQLETKGIAVAIADGVSSSAAGREASEAAINGFLNDYYSTPDTWTVKTSVSKVLNSINRWLFSQGHDSMSHRSNFVTTFSSIILKSNTAHLFHLGDSRIYRYRAGTLELCTRDHRVQINSDKSYLNRALGIELHIDIDYRRLDLEVGDCFILTTDGIHDFVSDRELSGLLKQYDSPQDIAKACLQLAQDASSDDNQTCQVVTIQELPDPQADEYFDRLTRLPFPPDLSDGNVIDGFQILREIHSSNRSQCYLALEQESGQKVVVKTPSINFADDPVYIKQFLQEEWIGKQIRSPHVLKIHQQQHERRFLYQVTEYNECKTLRRWMHDNPPPSQSKVGLNQAGIDKVRDIVEQIAKGLRAFHRMEVVHRDLKPENIIIDQHGVVRIIDFGSAWIQGDNDTATPLEFDHLVGTINYTAPEYLDNSMGTAKSDLYSLAVITYEMLSGELPYAGADSERSIRKRHYKPLDKDKVPVWINGAIEKALQNNPEKRYEDIFEFIYDLKNPNSAFLPDEHVALIEKNPVKFWQITALLLFLTNLILLYLVFK